MALCLSIRLIFFCAKNLQLSSQMKQNGLGIAMQQAHDYLAEVEELSNLLRDQPESIFLKRTLFKSWTVNDVIGHLYMFDLAALKSLQNENEFAKIYSKVSAHLDQGMSLLEPISFFEGA